jgi:DNA-binding NtrC family response regulator
MQDVKDGRFREDLYYRLNVLPIHVPPLRERTEDIPPLTAFFIQKFNKKLDRHVRGLDPAVEELFSTYDWPGNIRELENLIERLVLMTQGETIRLGDVPQELVAAAAASVVLRAADQKKPFKDVIREKTEEVERQMIIRVLEECEGNISKAAKQLGLSRKGLHLKLARYNLREGRKGQPDRSRLQEGRAGCPR